MKTHIWLGAGLLALLCTGLTSDAEAAKKGGEDAAIAESDVKAPSDRATGQASGKRTAGKPGKLSSRALPTKGGESSGGGSAGKLVPWTTRMGHKCCASCNKYNDAGVCIEAGQCEPGYDSNCNKTSTK